MDPDMEPSPKSDWEEYRRAQARSFVRYRLMTIAALLLVLAILLGLVGSHLFGVH